MPVNRDDFIAACRDLLRLEYRRQQERQFIKLPSSSAPPRLGRGGHRAVLVGRNHYTTPHIAAMPAVDEEICEEML